VGGVWHEVPGDDPARTVVRFARDHQITQIVVGATRRSRFEEVSRGSVVRKILRFAAESGIDVHVIARRNSREADRAERLEHDGEVR
jgi:two-component system sensor histidine kinase KdpD